MEITRSVCWDTAWVFFVCFVIIMCCVVGVGILREKREWNMSNGVSVDAGCIRIRSRDGNFKEWGRRRRRRRRRRRQGRRAWTGEGEEARGEAQTITSERKRMNMHITTKMETPPPEALCSFASSSVFGNTSNFFRNSVAPSIFDQVLLLEAVYFQSRISLRRRASRDSACPTSGFQAKLASEGD